MKSRDVAWIDAARPRLSARVSQHLCEWQFRALLLVLIWVPLPLGSNRTWAWALLQLTVFSLTFVYILAGHRVAATPPGSHWILRLLGLLLLWQALYLVPLPAVLVETLSPQVFGWQQLAEVTQHTLSIDRYQSQQMLLKTACYACVLYLTLSLVNTRRRLRDLLVVILFCGVYQALYGAFEVLSGAAHSVFFSLPVTSKATGSFVYQNHFAAFLLLSFGAGVAVLNTQLWPTRHPRSSHFQRRVLGLILTGPLLIRLALALVVIGLVMSHSRAANAALFSVIALLAVVHLGLTRWHHHHTSRATLWLLVSLLLIDVLVLSQWFGLDKIQQRLTATVLADESRLDVLRVVAEFPLSAWLTGVGPGSFYAFFPQFQPATMAYFYDHLHNDVLQWWLESGLPGIALAATLYIATLWQLLRVLGSSSCAAKRGVANGILLGLLAFSWLLLVDFPTQSPAIAVYLMVLIGITWRLETRSLWTGISVGRSAERPSTAVAGAATSDTPSTRPERHKLPV